MMSGFDWYLNQINPRTGRVLTEQGAVFNEADWMEFQQRYSLLWATINNGASILSIRMENLAASVDHNFVLDIPEGRVLALFSRDLTISEGRYFSDAISVDSIDLSTGVTNGITAPLDKTKPAVAQTVVRHKVGGAVNPVVREFGFVDTGSAVGAARSSGTTSTAGVLKILEGPSILRVRKTDEGSFTANIVFIAWEYDA